MELVASLLLQGASVFLVARCHPRGHRVTSLGFLFILVAFVFHGVGEVLQRIFPERATYREFVRAESVDQWLLIVSAAFVLYAVAYYFLAGRADRNRRKRTADWRPSWQTALLLVTPLWVVAVGVTIVASTTATYWWLGLMSQFLLLGVALTTFLYIRQSPHPRVVFALLIQSAALALVGQRLEIVAAAIMVIWASSFIGRPISARAAVAVFSVIAALAIVISSARTVSGHFLGQDTLEQRVMIFEQGVIALTNLETYEYILQDYVYRVDGNAWAAIVGTKLPLYGPTPIRGLLYGGLTVPRFIYQDKLSTPIEQRAEKAYLVLHSNIPASGVTIQPGPDWLTTIFGAAYAYGSWYGLLLFATGLGAVLALVDRYFARRTSFSNTVIGMGIVWCITSYERGFDNVLLTMRGVLLLWLIVKAITLAGRISNPRPIPASPLRQ